MADHSELKRLVEQGSLPPIVSTLIAEIDRLTGFVVHRRAQEEQYDEALIKVAGQRDQLKDENEALRKFIIGLAEGDAQIAYAYADLVAEHSHD